MSNLTENIIYSLLKSNSLKISKQNLKNAFDNHPFDGTLLQIKQGFNALGIPNLAIELNSNDKDKLLELPIPFISHLKSTREFILINELENNQVKYIDQSGKKILEDWSIFEKKWSGIALLAFPEFYQNNTKTQFFQQFTKILPILTILLILAFYGLESYIRTSSWIIPVIFLEAVLKPSKVFLTLRLS